MSRNGIPRQITEANSFQIPREITENDFISWRDRALTLPDKTAITPDNFTLTYHIRGKDNLDLTGTADGDCFLFESDFPITAGNYRAQIAAYKSPNRYTLGYVNLLIHPDLSTVTDPYDPRTFNEKMLGQVQSAIASALEEKAAGKRVEEYKIGTRELTYNSFDTLLEELRRLEKYYKWAVAREKQGGTNQKIMRF